MLPKSKSGIIKHKDTARLVVIDVLAKFRAPALGKNAYQEDYAALSQLQELATQYGITIIVICHTRKGTGEDPVDEISGTLGIAGCADGFLVLKKVNPGWVLIGRGRDTDDIDLAATFSPTTCRWTMLEFGVRAACIRRTFTGARSPRQCPGRHGRIRNWLPCPTRQPARARSAPMENVSRRSNRAGQTRGLRPPRSPRPARRRTQGQGRPGKDGP